MRRVKMLFLALTAIFALGVVGASVASAETDWPEILPVPTEKEPLTFTVESDEKSEPELEATKEKTGIICKKVKGTGEFTSKRLGVGSLDFEGECKSAAGKCNTEGDASGTILLPKIDIHLVDILEEGKLRLGIEILPLPQPFKIKCGLGEVEIKGSVLGLVLVNDLEKTKHIDIHFGRSSAGEQIETVCILDKAFCEPEGKPKTFRLEANFGKGFELAAEIVLVLILFLHEIEIHF